MLASSEGGKVQLKWVMEFVHPLTQTYNSLLQLIIPAWEKGREGGREGGREYMYKGLFSKATQQPRQTRTLSTCIILHVNIPLHIKVVPAYSSMEVIE